MSWVFNRKLLVVTDAALKPDSVGLTRTLLNSLCRHPEHLLKVVSRDCGPTPYGLDRPWRSIGVPPNFVGRALRPFTRFAELSALCSAARTLPAWFTEFKPDLILVSGSSCETLLVADRLRVLTQKPLVTFFMDDLRSSDTTVWRSGTGRRLIKDLLSASAGVIFISDALQTATIQRYQVTPHRYMILHNPVPHTEFAWNPRHPEGGIHIVYAGSLWGMHLDAMEMTAAVVSELHTAGKSIRLSVYTPSQQAASLLCKLPGVSVHPCVGYQDLPRILGSGDLLLVTTSFADDFRHLVAASLQTKLTDYLAAGRALLSVGPAYSACCHFVEQLGLGFTAAGREALSMRLTSFLESGEQSDLDRIGIHNRKILESHFSQDAVLPKLGEFLKECAAE